MAESPAAARLLDIGCGAGNFSLHLASGLPLSGITLIDLSRPMLDRATERLQGTTPAALEAKQGDIRDLEIGDARFDVIVAGAVLHHLRGEEEWEAVFLKIRRALSPGGLFAVYDLIDHDSPGVRRVMWDYYRKYLVDTLGEQTAQGVFRVLDTEDSPRGLMWQIRLLDRCGFSNIEIVHKHAAFAAFLAHR